MNGHGKTRNNKRTAPRVLPEAQRLPLLDPLFGVLEAKLLCEDALRGRIEDDVLRRLARPRGVAPLLAQNEAAAPETPPEVTNVSPMRAQLGPVHCSFLPCAR